MSVLQFTVLHCTCATRTRAKFALFTAHYRRTPLRLRDIRSVCYVPSDEPSPMTAIRSGQTATRRKGEAAGKVQNQDPAAFCGTGAIERQFLGIVPTVQRDQESQHGSSLASCCPCCPLRLVEPCARSAEHRVLTLVYICGEASLEQPSGLPSRPFLFLRPPCTIPPSPLFPSLIYTPPLHHSRCHGQHVGARRA